MRTTAIILVLLTAPPGSAQTYADCRGNTLIELSNCIIESTPPVTVAPEAEEAPTFSPMTTRPARIGGAIAPTNLRAAPPVRTLSAVPSGQARTTAVPRNPQPLAAPPAVPGTSLYGNSRTGSPGTVGSTLGGLVPDFGLPRQP
jgi:hypothetical protein